MRKRSSVWPHLTLATSHPRRGKLSHQNLETASVQELVRVFSGQDRDLAPHEPGSLANVAGFFAILNHGLEKRAPDRLPGQAIAEAGKDAQSQGKTCPEAK
jgi:hypothetical protein